MTGTFRRIVVDTNVIASAIIFPQSIPRRALLHALGNSDVLFSGATREELREVVSREKFDRYLARPKRMAALERILDQMREAVPAPCESGCRDPKDFKFLELAVGGAATLILSGDSHLLELHPYGAIQILSPLDFLAAQTNLQ